ncbi:MAG: glycosyltransferase [Sphingomonas sp.]|nr:glycosyltransferase [Sphingomonas sp.]
MTVIEANSEAKAIQKVSATAVKHDAPLILFAVTHSSAGGLRELWSDIAEGLALRGYAVGRFALYAPASGDGEGVDWAAWHHIVERPPRSIGATLKLFSRLVKYLRQMRPVAIVTAMPAANVAIPLAVRLAGLPTRVFVTHHSPTHTHNALLDRLDSWTGSLRNVAAVISVSDAVSDSLAHKPGRYRAKRRTIHNALPQSIEQLIDDRRIVQHQDPGCHVVALGRLSYQKNYPMLLSAFARLPGITLEIVGGGEDEADLRSLAKELGIAERVHFAGMMPRIQALDRAARAEIFVQVSRYEGHSLALIEAARLGLPLIVSDIPEQVEAITAADGERCGIAVPLGDVDELARRIATLIDNPMTRAHWSRLARKLALERSHMQMIDRYEQMLVDVARSR